MAKQKQPVRKSECPVSRKEFAENAKPIVVTVNGQPLTVLVKEFSSGSFGYYAYGKANVEVNGETCKCQCGLNVVVVGSKEAD